MATKTNGIHPEDDGLGKRLEVLGVFKEALADPAYTLTIKPRHAQVIKATKSEEDLGPEGGVLLIAQSATGQNVTVASGEEREKLLEALKDLADDDANECKVKKIEDAYWAFCFPGKAGVHKYVPDDRHSAEYFSVGMWTVDLAQFEGGVLHDTFFHRD